MDTETHLEATSRGVGGRLALPGASAAAEVNVLMGSGSRVTAMSEELAEALKAEQKQALVQQYGLCL